jgi:ribonuclease J
MANKQDKRGPAGEDEVVFAALGGLGEIGMNAYVYGLGVPQRREWLLVDLGITFPEGEFDPGVDVILPDIRFLEERRKQLKGILITHAHEDHIGAVLELWPRLQVPVYCTPFAAGMLRAKRAGYGGAEELEITEVEPDSRFSIGGFDVELITMAHSIPETSAVALRTPQGMIVHTADWKLDDEPVVGGSRTRERMPELGEEGVLALICDSTNAMRDGVSPSELDIAKSLANIVKSAEGRVAVTTFASNIARIKSIGSAAKAAGRKLIIAGRALHRNIQVAIDTGYLPEGFDFHDQQSFKDFRRNEVVCLLTGSQGEDRAALAKVAASEHRDVELTKGDTVVFSSRTIPGNERSVGSIQNALTRMGCEIVTDAEALVHVTGHPRRDELRQMYAWLKPQVMVPMHGEARHLKANALLAKECGVKSVVIADNGDIVRLGPGPAKIIDDAPTGRLFRDGNLLLASDDEPVRQRRKLAISGIVVAALVMDRHGEVLDDPIVVLDGIPERDDNGDSFEDIALDAIEGVISSLPRARRKDPKRFSDSIRSALRSEINAAWGKRPIAKVMVSVLDD